ncbi:MAG TPA: hypothetical protein VMI54_21865 [Polyangiaceae bacterium]|nr:hypothetical protein [Polyangiaceae bacterium]
MAEVQGSKKKKKKSSKRTRKEHRYVGEQTYASKVAVGVGALGAALLGAGAYDRWIFDNPHAYAVYLVGIGACALVGAVSLGDLGTLPVRVGDLGIAIERGSELERIGWCDLKRVYADKGKLFLEGKESTSSITIAAHPKAVARILAEGTRRVPEAMDVKRGAIEGLPSPREDDGEVLTVEAPQVAGRSCAASGKTIAFERDARLCPQCGEVYLKDRVPKKCLTCGTDLGERALET